MHCDGAGGVGACSESKNPVVIMKQKIWVPSARSIGMPWPLLTGIFFLCKQNLNFDSTSSTCHVHVQMKTASFSSSQTYLSVC